MNVCSCQNAYQSWIIIIQRIYVFRVSISWAVREVKLEDRNGPSKAVQADSPSASQYASTKPVRNIQYTFKLDVFSSTPVVIIDILSANPWIIQRAYWIFLFTPVMCKPPQKLRNQEVRGNSPPNQDGRCFQTISKTPLTPNLEKIKP